MCVDEAVASPAELPGQGLLTQDDPQNRHVSGERHDDDGGEQDVQSGLHHQVRQHAVVLGLVAGIGVVVVSCRWYRRRGQDPGPGHGL